MTAQISTGFPGSVQDGTRRYKSVHEFPVSVPDGTNQYIIFQIDDGTRRYKMVQDGTSQYMICTVTLRIGRYSTVQVSTGINILYIPVHTGMYWYVQVCPGMYRYILAQNSTLHFITLHPLSCADESQHIAWLVPLA